MATTSLGENHRRHLLHAFLDIHRRLAALEGRIAEAATPSPFSDLVNDLALTEAKVVLDHFARIRSAMLVRLQELGVPLEVRRISLRWAFDIGLLYIQNSVDEIGPRSLRGYGALDADGARLASEIQQDLERLTDRVRGYLRQGLGRDLGQRLARLGAGRDVVGSLSTLERVISRWRLVEFRPALDMIVGRLEDPSLEIALFGRVSSGKSSLLNHVAGIDALPVGVTPVTAVPTRLTYGEAPSATISFAESAPRAVGVEQLGEFASEEGNPGNRKHVVGILVRLPSARLREGVVFVDTPGVGSLAPEGGAESLAYLPRCDLGVVLIDAAGALDREDLALLRTLYESGIPGMVLLSKADLLTPPDRGRLIGYIRDQVLRGLGIDVPVHPVSTVGADESLLGRWFDGEVGPLQARHRELVESSLRRKAAHLRESVAVALELRLGRARLDPGSDAAVDAPTARRLLDESDAALREAKERWLEWSSDRQALCDEIPEEAARLALGDRRAGVEGHEGPVVRATRTALARRERSARALVDGVGDALGRALDGLRRAAAPLVRGEAAQVRDIRAAGLPAADLSRLRGAPRLACPWWAGLAPGLAFRSVGQGIRDRLGPSIRDAVEFNDRRLHAWIKGELDRLIEVYEILLEPIREQIRRMASDPDERDVKDRGGMEADLRELRATEHVEPAPAD